MDTLTETTTEQTAQDSKKNETNKIKTFLTFLKSKLKESVVKIGILMFIIFVIIIILLVKRSSKYVDNNIYVQDDINIDEHFVESTDERLNNFIYGYFNARMHLDFVNIYKAFNKDYMALKGTKESDKIENGILYEKNYVDGYNNFQIFTYKGLEERDKVVIMTYDTKFYFSDESIPSMLIGYIKDDGNTIYFKENYDIAETKYIRKLLEKEEVKTLYAYVKEKLEILLANNSELKLAYNSLRQYDMNPNNDVMDDKNMLMDKVFLTNLDVEEMIELTRKKEAIDEEE